MPARARRRRWRRAPTAVSFLISPQKSASGAQLIVLIDRGADCSPELVETKAQPSSDSVLFLSAGRSRPARAARMPMHDLTAVRSELQYSRAHPVAFDIALSEIGCDAVFERRPRQMA